MQPRVFISSTYYDLKYVRESIEQFIESYGFDPVLFESGRVTFEHGRSLDTSCYQEVDSCHIMILIIGGRYGSATSQQEQNIDYEKYDAEYTSITKGEFETAAQNNIPVFIFIDKNVYAEYQTYKQNITLFNKIIKENNSFKFAHVDSINIFKFIQEVSKRPIKTFERVEEIIEYLRSQFSGMFYLYLNKMRTEPSNKTILNSVNELNTVTSKINSIVEALGRKMIDQEELKQIEDQYFKTIIDVFLDQFSSHVAYAIQKKTTKANIKRMSDKLASILIEDILIFDYTKTNDYESYSNQINEILLTKVKEQIPNLIIKDFAYFWINSTFFDKINPLIVSDERKQELHSLLSERIRKDLEYRVLE
ncbi:DUF4062 domain-containing protein [Hymenobacter jeollabukensis]|uniref:DUF4062 domain-containing protein n=1 Tax=Hymenobacter jeollabukensis TaxID=2025313 RepID=A0A5R8WR07_9BACT|nr:DUF4062 domain-containing protein [Hymenobacter jeollabukensis]TLM92401.1 DUF4062 domain-containing protein [Hymenobacter jeollabukensis]